MQKEQAALHRLQLSDLAGIEAVAKLDEDFCREKELLAKLIGKPQSGVTAVPGQSATGSAGKPSMTD